MPLSVIVGHKPHQGEADSRRIYRIGDPEHKVQLLCDCPEYCESKNPRAAHGVTTKGMVLQDTLGANTADLFCDTNWTYEIGDQRLCSVFYKKQNRDPPRMIITYQHRYLSVNKQPFGTLPASEMTTATLVYQQTRSDSGAI